jgi:hypothetical protein
MAKSKDVMTQIRKATGRRFSAEEKIRVVLEGLSCKTIRAIMTLHSPAHLMLQRNG